MALVKVDPKAWFSTERTFLHWARLAQAFAAICALLLAAWPMTPFVVCGAAVPGMAAIALLLHAYRQHRRRAQALSLGRGARLEDFADRKGTLLLATSLTTVFVILVAATAAGVDVDRAAVHARACAPIELGRLGKGPPSAEVP
eukprot:CAMPEP_0175673666 /NCGR_PEP_ID=MMETSP0097-20121207/21316_1 /TAXON_ID=311494 /ORGANISM="Alexandrium monilatum, Strain CCMP3105" /LENGTH=143 /DNA_ID=CAMNT_0016980325 /DNA_START=52 /DNA_END=480 /DNA_ORIENTATION=-